MVYVSEQKHGYMIIPDILQIISKPLPNISILLLTKSVLTLASFIAFLLNNSSIALLTTSVLTPVQCPTILAGISTLLIAFISSLSPSLNDASLFLSISCF